jgi:hypothetical protein
MHPLVRDLYKRVLIVGRDYPTGLSHVKTTWKRALRSPQNCPSCYTNNKIAEINNQHNDEAAADQAVPLSSSSSLLPGSASKSIGNDQKQQRLCNEEITYAVQKGRNMVKEMVGIIQLKKYRSMNQRYGSGSGTANHHSASSNLSDDDIEPEWQRAMQRLVLREQQQTQNDQR